MGLIPYNFDSEYSSRGKLQFSHRKNCVTISLFCMIPTIFQIANNPYKILLCFSFENYMCEKCFGSRILLLFSYLSICVVSKLYLVEAQGKVE